MSMESVSVLIPEEEVEKKIREIAEQITKDYAGKELKLICILKGSVFFTTELAKRIGLPVKLDFMSVSSYGDDVTSSGRVRIVKDLDESIRGQHVLVIEDIIDSGHTLSFLLEMLKSRPKASRFARFLTSPAAAWWMFTWTIRALRFPTNLLSVTALIMRSAIVPCRTSGCCILKINRKPARAGAVRPGAGR